MKDLADNLTPHHHLTEWKTETFNDQNLTSYKIQLHVNLAGAGIDIYKIPNILFD